MMGDMKHLKQCIEIMIKYDANELNSGFYAEHDQIWVGTVDPDVMTQEDRDYLDKLGWFYDDVEMWSRFC